MNCRLRTDKLFLPLFTHTDAPLMISVMLYLSNKQS